MTPKLVGQRAGHGGAKESDVVRILYMLKDLRLTLMKQICAKKFFSRSFKKAFLRFEQIAHTL